MKIGILAFGGVGLILLLLGGYSYYREANFLSTAIPVTGTVTDLDRSDSAFCPVIEFTTPEGQPVRFYGNVCSNPPAYDLGDQVELLYDSPEVNEVQMKDSFFSKWGGVLIYGIIGSVFFGVGLIMLYASWKA